VKTYRLDLTADEIENLRELVSYAKKHATRHLKKNGEELYFNANLVRKIDEPRKIIYSAKKSIAAEKATAARSKQTKEKVQNAINILLLEGKEITAHRVSKISGVAFTTARKYLNTLIENEQ
jgi:Fic family protein